VLEHAKYTGFALSSCGVIDPHSMDAAAGKKEAPEGLSNLTQYGLSVLHMSVLSTLLYLRS
jgi:hypothetical protein